MKTKHWLPMLTALLTVTTFQRNASALTNVVSPFGSDAVIVMVIVPGATVDGVVEYGADGMRRTISSQAIEVFYYDIEPGTTNYGACANIGFPGGSLSDDLVVNGSSHADIFQPTYPVICGGFYRKINLPSDSGPAPLMNGHSITLHGGGGNDIMESNRQFGFFALGDDGNDYMYDGWEGFYMEGDAGNDSLWASNGLYNGADKTLNGGDGNDCLQNDSGNNSNDPNNHAYMTCGPGDDTMITITGSIVLPGTVEDAPNCEHHAKSPASRCMARFDDHYGCNVDSDCMSGACVASFCVQNALLVVGNTTLSLSDQKLLNELTSANYSGTDIRVLSFKVTIKKDSDVVAADANGKALVVISESVSSANVGTKLTSISTPILNLDAAVQGYLNMTSSAWNVGEGTTTGTQVTIAKPQTGPHGAQLASGLSGTQTIMTSSSTLNWGVPGSGADVAARVVGSSTQATAYVYEKGAAMYSGTAPGRRGFLFDHETSVPNNNAIAWRLFDTFVRWAAAPMGTGN